MTRRHGRRDTRQWPARPPLQPRREDPLGFTRWRDEQLQRQLVANALIVDDAQAALDANACYDQSRVFATGHSSGAQFIVQRLCAGESRWRAVAPVASSVYCSSWEPIPALVIHGIGDTERQAYGLDDGDGLKDIVPYRTSNGCSETFAEVPVDGCTSGGVQVDPGCRDFDGCGQRTRWCQHDDPQYGTSHHGVPCFGARVIKSFFDSYR